MTGVAVRPLSIDRWERPYKLRMPFRFGVTTATHGRQTLVRARIALADGTEAVGYAAEALGAKWFDKNLDLTDADNHNQLRKSLELASASRLAAAPATPFALHADDYDDHIAACGALQLNPLIASYGQSLVDRAILDAMCRGLQVSFYRAVNENLVGIAPHPVIADLGDFDFSAFLGGLAPAQTMDVRHTVGLADPITADDQEAGSRIGDGLPETLEEVVAVHGNRYFKIKVCGDEAADLERLGRIAAVLDRTDEAYFVTLDGNEQFEDARQITDFYRKLAATPGLSRFRGAILYVEQPINRAMALSETVEPLAEQAPVIIDESDGELSTFVTAKTLGYAGVSSKACKGIYKSIVNMARCHAWNAPSGGRYFMSAEDLTCEPGVALQQDLVLVNLLGLTHVERNAHHFIDGFGGRAETEERAFCESHPDLYHRDGGKVRLKINGGAIAIGSLDCPGFGTSVEPSLEGAEPMPTAQWPLAGDKA